MLAFRKRGQLLAALLSTLTASLLISGAPAATAAAPTYLNSGTASISGTVSAPSGVDLSTITFQAIGPDHWWSNGSVNSDGTYSITGVPAGNVVAYFRAQYANSNTVVNLAAKTGVLSLTSGESRTQANATMTPAATISGTVSGPAGVDTSYVHVEAFDVNGDGTTAVGTTSAFSGQYSLNVPAGSYKLRFYDPDRYESTGTGYTLVYGTLVTQWYAGKTSFGTASPLTATGGQTTGGANVTLVQGGTITGTAGPVPTDNSYICIAAFPADASTPAATQLAVAPAGATQTAKPMAASATCAPQAWLDQDTPYGHVFPDGTYTIRRLPAGSFKVQAISTLFTATGTAPGSLAPQWYSGKILRSTAAPVPVGAAQAVAGIDFTLRPMMSFADVPTGTLFHDEITWLGSEGISTGWTEADGSHTYRPVSPVNRDAMAAFLYRLAGSPNFTPPAVSPFTDVATDNPFYKQITWLATTGISTGYPGPNNTRTFQPLSPVNRDAMAAFLYRFAGSPAYTAPASSPFTDVATNNQFYAQINWLADTKITTGWTATDGTRTFQPVSAVNRDAMAAFMSRYQNMDAQKQ